MLHIYRAQLNFVSVLKLFAVVGFGTGLLMSIFSLGSLFFGESIGNVVLGIVLFPMVFALQALVFAVLGYPFYQWYCRHFKGQHVEGLFAKIDEQPERSMGL